MPRQMRIDFPGAIHHVMSRGDRRENIYLDDVDRQDFLKTLAEACQKTDWQVHAYCLMRNHFHLVLEQPGVVSRGEGASTGLDAGGPLAGRAWHPARYGRRADGI